MNNRNLSKSINKGATISKNCKDCKFSEQNKHSSIIYCEKQKKIIPSSIEDCKKWEKKTLFSRLFKN